MPRILGIDYGSRRIGIAISDPDGRIASPHGVVRGSGSVAEDARAVARLAASLEAAEFVVGLPLHMDGSESDQTALTRAFAAALEKLAAGPVHLHDERLSSRAADELLAGRSLTRKKRRARHDAIAAAVILQGYLDAADRGPGASG